MTEHDEQIDDIWKFGPYDNFPDELAAAVKETRNPMGFLVKHKGIRDVGLGSNAAYHAARLSEEGRSEQEKKFADALETHGNEFHTLFPDYDQRRTITSVVSTEGSDTVMWWTLAPYIHAELQTQGVDPRESVRSLLDWASRVGDHFGSLTLTLPGLETYNRNPNAMKTFILSDNPAGPSHRLAAKEAKRLVTANIFPRPTQ